MSDLLQATCRLLRDRPKTLSLCDLAAEIDVSVSWLSSLLAEVPPSGASVTKIERLYNRLSPEKLQLVVFTEQSSKNLNW